VIQITRPKFYPPRRWAPGDLELRRSIEIAEQLWPGEGEVIVHLALSRRTPNKWSLIQILEWARSMIDYAKARGSK